MPVRRHPPDLTGVVAIAGGAVHSLALKSDGCVVVWGNNRVGQMDIPEDLQNVESIAAGAIHNLAIKSDGTVVAWGDNRFGQIDVPAGLSEVIAITAGAQHSLAVKSDGTIIAWGDNSLGQLNVPEIASGSLISTANAKGTINSQFNAGSVTSIAAGLFHNIISLADGTVVAWGNDADGQTELPEALSGVTEVVAGADHNLALLGTGIPLISTVGPGLLEVDPGATAEFTVVVEGQEPLSFQWRKDGQIIEGATSKCSHYQQRSKCEVRTLATIPWKSVIQSGLRSVPFSPWSLTDRVARQSSVNLKAREWIMKQ